MKKLMPLIIIILLGSLLVKGWWNFQLGAISNQEETKVFVINKGEGFSSVADRLKKENLIKSTFAFSLLGKKSGLVSQIKAGTFKLSSSLSSEEILKTLTENPVDNWVTLLEGWRVEEMAEKLNTELGVDKKEFLKVAKEGYMFPDTYLFPKEFSAEQIAQKLRETFELKYSQEIRSKIKAQGLTESQGVVLASIVEREGRSQEVRTKIASILLKRFKIDMGLNADATVQYILGYQKDEKSWWKRNLTRNDLTVESSYNTYLHVGLPPTPIANPSLSSLQAVADADSSTPYLYYYHDLKGNSYYAKTLDEHNENVANHP